MYPRGVYSRVVGCGIRIEVFPATTFCVCGGIGEQVWLINVSVWFSYKDAVGDFDTEFRVLTSTERWVSAAQALNFDEVVPMFEGNRLAPWHSFDQHGSFSWDMNRLYTGAGRRFGLWIYSNAPAGGVIRASFQISEG